jgi:hypothetical protein
MHLLTNAIADVLMLVHKCRQLVCLVLEIFFKMLPGTTSSTRTFCDMLRTFMPSHVVLLLIIVLVVMQHWL